MEREREESAGMMDPIRRGFNNKHGVCVVCGVVARPVAERAAATDTERESVANAERVASGETRAAQREIMAGGVPCCVAVRPRCRRVARKRNGPGRCPGQGGRKGYRAVGRRVGRRIHF